ncbi:MAG: hypothetical protein AMS18_08425 [Gemmatimonas sp. SG8_17]|nr:MAG: hypothetical protein AMS18_08425 [Gemmatimonas sp. SG8_17]
MRYNIAKLVGTALSGALLIAANAAAQQLQTPAERTNFQAGPTMYDDLMGFVYELDARSELMQVRKITETLRGRDVVLSILSNPPVYQASDLIGSAKPVVLIVNNVHGGEVAGKDASLILMRDLLFGELRPLLDQAVVLNIPTINPDGAEERRRTNEQNFDMNRDYLKLESQEIQALVTKVLHEWQPDIHVDTHHGGSAPYVITYQTIMNPAGDPEIMRVANEVIVPRIREALRAEDYDGFWYSGPRSLNGVAGWAPTSVEPRKQHVYSGLANIVDFLFETPSGSHRVINNGTEVVPIPREERYQHQVRGQYIAQRELIRFAADEPELLRLTVRNAKEMATRRGADDSDDDQIVLEYEQVAKMEVDIWREKGWADRQGQGGGPPGPGGGEREVEYELLRLPVFTKFEPTRTTTRPWGYVLPPQLATVVPLLLDHEIAVQRLAEPTSLDVEVYYATELDNSEYFQGHYLNKVTAVKRAETVEFPTGSFFVPAGQPKANLISYILEPETDDNLITWGFLDTHLEAMTAEETQAYVERMARSRGSQEGPPPPGQLIPMYRLMKMTDLKGTLVESFNSFERNRYVR